MPNKAVTYFDLGLDFSNSDRFEKAIEFFTKAIEVDNDYSEAYEQRAAVYLKLKNDSSFLEDNDKAILLDSENHGAHFSFFCYYLGKLDYKSAQTSILKCLEICPDQHVYELNLSMIYRQNKLWNDVLKITTKILKDYPNDFNALNDRSMAYMNKKEYKPALMIYKQLLLSGKTKNLYKQNVGFCLLELGHYQESIIVFDEILSEEHIAYAYDNRGFAKHKMNKNKEALMDINKSLEIDTSNCYAYKNRAIVFLSEDKKDDAQKDLLMAKELGYSEFYDEEVNELLKKHF